MKALTSSIALITLVALGCSSAFAFFRTKSPYEALDEYLVGKTTGETLEANFEAINTLFEEESTVSKDRIKEFGELADAFRMLEDDFQKAHPKPCSNPGIDHLHTLIDAALKHNKNFMNRPEKRLDRLLIDLTTSVKAKCYEYLYREWNSCDKTKRGPVNPNVSTAVEHLTKNVSNDVFKRFIYRPRNTPKSTTSKDNRELVKLIKEGLLKGQNPQEKPLSSPKLKHSVVKEQLMTQIIYPCHNLSESLGAKVILTRAVKLAELHRIVLPEKPFLEDSELSKYMINSMPAYVMCREVVKRGQNLIIPLKKLLSA